MKKIIFSALASVAFAGSALASNGIVIYNSNVIKGHDVTLMLSDLGACAYKISGITKDGRPFERNFIVNKPVTSKECDALKNDRADQFTADGSKVQSTESTWVKL